MDLYFKEVYIQQFREWKAVVEKSSGRKIESFCSDNEEYTSVESVTYLTGAGEQLNFTLIEGVRTMLADLKLPHRFWTEALSTCVYLRNCRALDEITPYEAWSDFKPDVRKSPPHIWMQCICSCA